ncbi:GNAT family N-acetyltransferase [Myceligenerans pegani]|uniref:GNAT family N-acetyltransferase n=1 Tax=Myceligenerans pegani TaxID=2776917 RepID=A0ABR9N5M5_9MICO|nr:GNAT family N-acetyltransferase [Myceligenerans sp. TRM 65318]MBE1878969.1 GNAT family N-acetyltransferase [Myceligenerans sp. TRM 65318]MBE3021240.1 GNAT family N-acetyltransferase [Myceligenerans sp. TRM 65318]
MDFTIRPIAEAEHDALGELTAQAYLREGFLEYGEDDPYLPRLRDVSARAAVAEVLVAVEGDGESGDRMLGGVTYVPAPGPMSDLARDGEAEIRMLVVGPDVRRRGVGEALARACLDRARASGRTAVVLCSQPQMHAAHRVYERLGFVRDPERDWSPEEKRDLLLVAYRLGL